MMGYTVHVFRVNNGVDPDLYAGEELYSWENSEEGKWVMEHSNPKPSWHKIISYDTYGYLYQIRAYLTPKQLTYWKLKYE